MNTIIKTALAVGVVAGVAKVVHYANSLNQDIYSRFPHLDRKVLRKAYSRYLANAIRGEYSHLDLDNYTDEQMDELFLNVYYEILPK